MFVCLVAFFRGGGGGLICIDRGCIIIILILNCRKIFAIRIYNAKTDSIATTVVIIVAFTAPSTVSLVVVVALAFPITF